MAWPTDDLSVTNYDQGTDDPSLARSQLIDLKTKVSELIAGRATANGVCDLDGSALVPTARLPTIPTAKLPSSHTKDAASGIPSLNASSDLNLRGFDVTYDETRLALDNDFNGTEQVVLVRVGNQVTLTSVGTGTFGAVTHSSTSQATTTTGFIPSAFRPGTAQSVVVNANTILIIRVFVEPDGQLNIHYQNYAGTFTSTSDSSSGFSITYNLDGNIA